MANCYTLLYFTFFYFARIFWRKCTFFLEKVNDLKTQAKTTKFTTPTIQISPVSSKNWTLALSGGACSVWGGVHLQLSQVNLAQKFSALGCTCVFDKDLSWPNNNNNNHENDDEYIYIALSKCFD